MWEISAEEGGVIIGKYPHQLTIKVTSVSGGSCAIALLIGGAALFNVLAENSKEVLVLFSFGNLRLVVKLDLIHQQFGEALGLLMNFLIFRRESVRRAIGTGGRSWCSGDGGWRHWDG